MFFTILTVFQTVNIFCPDIPKSVLVVVVGAGLQSYLFAPEGIESPRAPTLNMD